MVENLPNLQKDINLHIQDEQIPNRINPKESMSRLIISKVLKTKDKENTPKALRE